MLSELLRLSNLTVNLQNIKLKKLPLYSIVLRIGLIFMLKQNFKIKHKYKYIMLIYNIKDELKFLHILDLIVFMPYLSYI